MIAYEQAAPGWQRRRCPTDVDRDEHCDDHDRDDQAFEEPLIGFLQHWAIQSRPVVWKPAAVGLEPGATPSD